MQIVRNGNIEDEIGGLSANQIAPRAVPDYK